jgi:hypothetical protein
VAEEEILDELDPIEIDLHEILFKYSEIEGEWTVN